MQKEKNKNLIQNTSTHLKTSKNFGIDSTIYKIQKQKNIVEAIQNGQNQYTLEDSEISTILKETRIYRTSSIESFDENFKIIVETEVSNITKTQINVQNNNNITIEEVSAAVNKLNNISSPGPDRIGTLK